MPLFLTHRNWAALAARVGIASVFIPHGLDKLYAYPALGWRGGEVWQRTFGELFPFVTKYLSPDQVELVAQGYGWTMAACGALVLVGFLTRPAVLPLMLMTGLQIFWLRANGYWFDATSAGAAAAGFGPWLVVLAAELGILFSGGGSTSVDKLIACEAEAEDIEYQWENEDDDYYGDDDR